MLDVDVLFFFTAGIGVVFVVEFFVVLPFLVLGPSSLILVPTRRRFCLTVVLDGAVVAVACIVGVFVFEFVLLGSSSVVCCGVAVAVAAAVVVGVPSIMLCSRRTSEWPISLAVSSPCMNLWKNAERCCW